MESKGEEVETWRQTGDVRDLMYWRRERTRVDIGERESEAKDQRWLAPRSLCVRFVLQDGPEDPWENASCKAERERQGNDECNIRRDDSAEEQRSE